jgi:hypothetical protein
LKTVTCVWDATGAAKSIVAANATAKGAFSLPAGMNRMQLSNLFATRLSFCQLNLAASPRARRVIAGGLSQNCNDASPMRFDGGISPIRKQDFAEIMNLLRQLASINLVFTHACDIQTGRLGMRQSLTAREIPATRATGRTRIDARHDG